MCMPHWKLTGELFRTWHPLAQTAWIQTCCVPCPRTPIPSLAATRPRQSDAGTWAGLASRGNSYSDLVKQKNNSESKALPMKLEESWRSGSRTLGPGVLQVHPEALALFWGQGRLHFSKAGDLLPASRSQVVSGWIWKGLGTHRAQDHPVKSSFLSPGGSCHAGGLELLIFLEKPESRRF